MNASDDQPSIRQLGNELTLASQRVREAIPREVTTPEAALQITGMIQWVLDDLRAMLHHTSARLHEHRFEAQPGVLGPSNGIEASTLAAERLEVAAGLARQATGWITRARIPAAHLTWPSPEAPTVAVPSIRELMTGRAPELEPSPNADGDAAHERAVRGLE